MYIYDLPTTGTISFTDFLVTTDLVSQVASTTQLRARLRAVLKENRAGTSSFVSKDDGGDQSSSASGTASTTDWMTIVKTIEEYLPHLLAVFNCVQTDDLILRYEPVFSWRTCVSSTRFRGPQRVDLAGLYYELASTLLTYALTLSNFASTTVSGLGSFERDARLSSEERKSRDDRLRWAADTLCRASGILLYLSQELLPRWRDQVGRVEGLPPDLTTEVTLGLSKVCLAEAQALAIRKLVSPSVGKAVDTVTPGPPLEKGHPSASLLAKLHLSVVEELESAVGLFKTVGEKGKVKGRRKGASGDAGLSANHEHELSRRISATRDHAFDNNDDEEDDDDDDNPGRNANDGGVGSKTKGLFSKFKRKEATSKHQHQHQQSRISGPHDVSPSPSSFGGGPAGGNSFYAPPSSTTSIAGGLDQNLEITSSLLKYLTFSSTFHRAMAYKWLGIDSGESTTSKIGSAIAFLTLSSTLLSSSSVKDLTSTLTNISISSSSLLPSSKTKTRQRGDKAVVEQELSTILHWLQSYRKLNDTVSFQPIPSSAEVTSKVPAGRAALGVKEFKLPTPKWGPGSQGYEGRGGGLTGALALDQLHLLDIDHPARKNLVALHQADRDGIDADFQGRNVAGYAGQGAYY
ncbi:uncharacterized protein UTRI_05491 [Ustilago trichophora]|uniref:pH-response regulator protein palC n=1 Tax=Ustilago trichophora TaxID=86804 RepID=A0A5C3EK79_9BASI|nr:uncharacterized protein UTRI_05491 [Ustilago trichophora]